MAIYILQRPGLLHYYSPGPDKKEEKPPHDLRCGSVETCRNVHGVSLSMGKREIAEAVPLRLKCMATVTLKNIKKIYPFSGDDIKVQKRKEKKL